MSADKEMHPNYTDPLGRPGGEIRPKLPVRKKEDFSQLVPHLCISLRQNPCFKAEDKIISPVITITKNNINSIISIYILN